MKENMDEIKQMINSEEYAGSDDEEQQQQQSQQEDSFGQQQGFDTEEFGQDLQTGFDDNKEAEGTQDSPETETFDAPSQQTTDFGGQDAQQQQQEAPQTEETESEPDESFDQRFDSPQQTQEPKQETQESEETEQSEPEEEREHETADSRSREQEQSRTDLKDSIPEAPETKEIDVPEIDKGPLFIRQQKFKAARNMIREMDHISREIEEVVSHLEEGIRQDRQTESDAKELLHRLEEDRKGVKDIISPKQE